MKKLVLAVLMAVGMLSVPAYAQQRGEQQEKAAKCAYTLEDARAGLKNYVAAGFVPRAQSDDGSRVFGVMVYHNPASKDKDSVDALALVLVDKSAQKEMTFAVIYIGPKKSVLFKRQMKDKEPTACFEKTLQDNPKENAK